MKEKTYLGFVRVLLRFHVLEDKWREKHTFKKIKLFINEN